MGLISGFCGPFDFSYASGYRESWNTIAQPETAEHGRARPGDRYTGSDVRPSVVVVIIYVDVSSSRGHRRQPRRCRHILEDRVAFAVEPLVEVKAYGRDLLNIIGCAGVVFGDGHVGAPIPVDIPHGDAGIEVGLRTIGVAGGSYQTYSLGTDLTEGSITLRDKKAV